MKQRSIAGTTILACLCLGFALPASAQSLKEQLAGTWMLTAGTEQHPDGKKVTPWSEGRLMLDANGNLAFFLIGRDRPKTGNDPRVPVGPAVAYYGTYSVNEAESPSRGKSNARCGQVLTGANASNLSPSRVTP
jgi:hypothetical protein